MSESVLIPAGPAHANVLAALHGTAFPRPWTAQAFDDLLMQPTIAGWIAGPEIPAGFILVRQAAGEAEIITLAVAEAERRRGIGRRLVDHALTCLHQAHVDVCHLEVAADNTAARKLYALCGFEECGRRKQYYRRSPAAVDAVLMHLALRSPKPGN